MIEAALSERAAAWVAEDPDPDTRAEVLALLAAAPTDRAAEAALADRFAARLQFGTAGLRGELGAGPNRMNRAVVIRAAAGLAAYLRERGGTSAVVGFDARRNSDMFARDTAAVLEGAGVRAMVLPHPLPTPVLAFAIRHLGADAGVMVTASHNPASANGYKVYLGDGAQITPPADAEISAAIDAVGPLALVPRGEEWVTLGDEIVDAYVDAVVRLSLVPDRTVRLAYTPLHGVGREVLERVLDRAGFPAPAVVAEQADPDPAFPTVPVPNPEEPGVLDRLAALAASSDADVALANDPDADRLAVVGGRRLSGDEVGALLAEHVLTHTTGGDRLVVTTIVSSSLLARIAAAHGVRYAETLTGFKWIVKAGGPGERFVFGYEEALGYCLGGWSPAEAGPPVRDKDGIAAALAVAELAASLKRAGATVDDALDDLARRHGLHATDQWSIRPARREDVGTVMTALRADPPRELAGRRVTAVDDLSVGVGGLPAADALRLRLGSEPAPPARIVVRPSGTEPKLKTYLEVVVPVPGTVAEARARAEAELRTLRDALAARLLAPSTEERR